MTEDEAKTKWCPYQEIRLNMMASTLGNLIKMYPKDGARIASGANENRDCIASGCMMWRKRIKSYGGLSEAMDDEGYCGLAGKP